MDGGQKHQLHQLPAHMWWQAEAGTHMEFRLQAPAMCYAARELHSVEAIHIWCCRAVCYKYVLQLTGGFLLQHRNGLMQHARSSPAPTARLALAPAKGTCMHPAL